MQQSIIKFSIVIPILNAAQHLNSLLSALEKQGIENSEYILVDNGSQDNSLQLIRNFAKQKNDLNVKVLEENKPGASAARNKGSLSAVGHWLIFTDADCIPEPHWLRDYLVLCEAPNDIGAIAGCIQPYKSENLIAKFLGLYTLPANRSTCVFDRFTLTRGGFPAANLAVRRAVFCQAGGFEESIRIYGEDHDLCAKIYKAGYKILATENAVVRHKHRTNLRGLIKQSFGFGKSHAFNLHKNVSGAFIFTMPFFTMEKFDQGSRIWIDLNQADKKILLLGLLSLIWNPFVILVPSYLVYMLYTIKQRAKKNGMPVTINQSAGMLVLLLLKSSVMTLGRIAGSLRYRVWCL